MTIHSRRTFFKQCLVGGVGCASVPGFLASAFGKGAKGLKNIGIHVNTVRAEMEQDFAATLVQLHDMGYGFVEARMHGNSEDQWLDAVRSSKLDHKVMGYGMGKFINDADELFRQAETFGVEFLVSYYPWSVRPGQKITRDIAMKSAETVNAVGKKVAAAGFRFNWHNHAWAFDPLADGTTPFDLMMQNTEPDVVGCELDVYWTAKSGTDPVHCLQQYPGRFDLLHIKDMDASPQKGIVCVGEGIIDLRAVVDAAYRSGCRHLIVEMEKKDSNGLECARASIESLRNVMAKS